VNEVKKIRVAIVAPGLQSEGGIKSVVTRIYPWLAKRPDLKITWIASQSAGSVVTKIGRFLGALASAIYYLPQSAVVHVHGTVGISLLRKSFFIWLARISGCRIAYHFHAPQSVFEGFFDRPGLMRAYALATLSQCDAIVVLSDSWRETVRKVLPDSRIVVIYNPVMEMLEDTRKPAAESKDVLYLAHLIKRKGFDDLIKAFSAVVDAVPNARLVFCGSGEMQYAEELVEGLGLSGNVIFRGWIPEKDIAKELSAAAVFCLPSYDEGLPMGILEAMSAGVAVVATPVGGIPDVLMHEDNALLVAPGDIEGLASQLVRLLTDDALRERLVDKALGQSDGFAPRKIAGQWVELYRGMMASQESRS
jgi:glycosyltransferase involved in cell wall biosynthesis